MKWNFYILLISISLVLSGCSKKRREKISVPQNLESVAVQTNFSVSEEELMNRAQKAFELEELDASITLLEEVLKNNPYHPRARRLLSLIFYNQGRDYLNRQLLSSAYNALERAYKLDSDNINVRESLAEIHLNLSEEYEREKSPVNAVLELEKVLIYIPYHQEATAKLIEFYEKYDFINQAEVFASKLIEENRVPGKLIEKIGDLFSKRGDFKKARKYWQTAQGYLPYDRELAKKISSLKTNSEKDYYVLASDMMEKGNYQKAYELFGEALKFRSDIGWQIHYFRGNCMQFLKKYKEAIEEWKLSLKKKSDNPYPAVKLSSVYLQLNLPDIAMEYYHRIRGNKNIEVSMQMVDILSEHGRDKEALEEIIALSRSFPKNQAVLEKSGLAYAKLGHYDLSIQCFMELIENNPYESKYYYNLGVVYSKQGELNHSLKMFEKAVSLNPSSDLYHYSLGLAHRNLGNDDLAIKSWNQVQKIKPDGQYARIVNPLLAQKKLSSEQKSFSEKTVKEESERIDEEAVFQYAKICYDSGRESTAISFFEKLIDSEKYGKDSSVFLTKLYSKNKNYIDSILHGFRSINFGEKNYFVYRAIADSYFNLKHYSKAIEYFNLASQSSQDNLLKDDCSYMIGLGYFYSRQYEEAYAVLDKVIRNSQAKEIAIKAEEAMKMASARIYDEDLQGLGIDEVAELTQKLYRGSADMGLYEFSLLGVEDYILMKGENINSLYEKGEFLFKLKKYDESMEVYRNILKKIPDSYMAYYRLGEIYYNRESYSESLREFENAYSIDPSENLIFKMIDISLKIPFPEKVKQYYRDAVKIVKNNKKLEKYEEIIKNSGF